MIGDAVNVAARLEALNKEYGTTILVGQGTRDAAGDAMRFRAVDEVKVKGKSTPTAIFELIAAADTPVDEEWLRLFAEARDALRAGNHAAALTLFETCLKRNPQDTCAAYYRRKLQKASSESTKLTAAGPN